MNSTIHLPVLLHEVLDTLKPKDGDVIVDGTFGGGGYTRSILRAANCRVVGLDRDPVQQAGRDVGIRIGRHFRGLPLANDVSVVIC